MTTAVFLTHAEVEIDPAVPVPDWGLNARGAARHAAFAHDPMLDAVTAVFSSAERKAIEGAAAASARLGLKTRKREALGENDRSATGYLPRDEFEATANEFFAHPDTAIRGWETARDAQMRIVGAVQSALAEERPNGDVLIVAHGGVGTLLRCHLKAIPITRDEDQKCSGGAWFAFPATMDAAPTPWRLI